MRTRGEQSEGATGGGPELAVVVISLGNEPGLVDAVRTLLSQRPRPEIVVVNTGGGDPGATLAEAGIELPLIDRPEPLHPGGARNLGLRATRAPFVGFLAADCRAEPGWVAERLRRHRAGAGAVASVMTDATAKSPSSIATHLLLHARRLTSTPAERRLHYGLSYDRSLLERLGPFREDLRQGEDSELNRRLPSEVTVEWAPGVRTAHANPRGPWQLIRDQYARGARSRIYRHLELSELLRIALYNRPLDAIQIGLRGRTSAQRRRILRAAPLLIPATVAYTLGLLRARRTETWPARPGVSTRTER
jgi:glycosyltransferase involved in cell wall biosynthesis